jgi:endonuclease/exonuclease/phosphatase family metal-dependent hydrolase
VALWLPVALSLLICASAEGADPHSLKLSTWNLEWLMATAEFDRLAADCVPQLARAEGRAIPCNIVEQNNSSKRRSPADFDRLRAYARQLDADVIALQEVDGPDAARLVFPDYDFCFTRRVHVQNVGFAVRRGIAFQCGDYAALGLPESSVRWGADLTLYPNSPEQIRMLAVHLKSGCHQQVLTNRREECQILADQIPVLKRWIQARTREGVAFTVMGDFNRRFSAERAYARDSGGRLISVWPELTQRVPPYVQLLNTTAGQLYIGCSSMDRFHAYIDHIVLGGPLTTRMISGSFERMTYADDDARKFTLSDHCPLAVRVTSEEVNEVRR